MTPAPMTIARSLTGARWRTRACDPAQVARLEREMAGAEPDAVLLQCLIHRGVTTADEAARFLAPQFAAELHSPLLLRDMPLAVARLRQAIARGERILIVTDFDVDGTTSSVILSQTLALLGAGQHVSCYIPDRFTEGYGLSKQIIEKAAAEGYQVIVTADIGIKSHAEARLAHAAGIDLIICDHHLPDGEDVPADAFAVLCPKGSSGVDYPNKHLAACGVSLKLADALLDGHPKRAALIASLAKLTAIGTVADMVDLSVPENRAIVTEGLRGLNERINNPGLRALLKLSSVNSPITATDIGFRIGPRINAAGRIAHANSVLALFAAPNDQAAFDAAYELNHLNARRQHIQSLLIEVLKDRLAEQGTGLDRVLLFAGTEEYSFHRGVLGIAASKVVEMTGRPTLICSIDESGVAHGSARSIEGFHLVDALDAVSDVLVKYGGHPMAAGFTVQADKIEDLRYRLNRYAAEKLSENDLGRVLTADCELTLEQITPQLIRNLARLEPHGIGNPTPLFLLRRLPLRSVQVLKEKHLKFNLGRERIELEALWWSAAEHHAKFADAQRINLMCRLELNQWGSRERCQLKVVDAAID